MCLVKLPDELNIFSQYLHLKGFLSTACVLFSFFFFFFFSFFFPFFFLGGGGRPRGGLNPLNPPRRSAPENSDSEASNYLQDMFKGASQPIQCDDLGQIQCRSLVDECH